MLAVMFFAQASISQSTETIKEEIRTLLQQLNQARLKHDRPALEKIYAPEFINVHSAGFIDDRATTIHEIMTTDSIRIFPIPSLQNLVIYGDVAILRSESPTNAGTVNSTRLAGVYVYAKKDGRWQILHAQGTPLLKERASIVPDSKLLDSYVGKYERNPGELIVVEKDGNFLLMKLVGRGIPQRKLTASSNTAFFDKLGTEYSFTKEENSIILTTRLQGGQESKWRKN